MRPSHASALPALCLLTSGVIAQCATQLTAVSPVPIATGDVYATTLFDPDGAGPEPLWLIAGGENLLAGETAAGALIAYDGVHFRDTGLPVSPGRVRALTVWNGELIAAGEFTFATSAGPAANNLARWDGTTWRHVGSGTNGAVHALAVWSGELVAGGTFTNAGGTAGTLGVARWNGAVWSAFGGGWSGFGAVTTPGVRALAVFQGSLYVGGSFQAQGPSPSPRHLARWNGTSWLAAGDPNQPVHALAVRTNAISIVNTWLFATGAFTSIGGVAASRVAAMDGPSLTWSALGAGFSADGKALHVRSTGLHTFELLGLSGATASRWNGTTWIVAATSQGARCLGVHSGQYVIGGTGPVGLVLAALLRFPFTGTNNTPEPVFGPGILGDVHDIAFDGNDLIAGGTLAIADGQVCNGIARRSGTTWSPLGSGVGPGAFRPTRDVRAVAVLSNGDVVVGGFFTSAGGVPASNVARWDGAAWSAMGAGLDDTVEDLLVMPNGDVVAVGHFTNSGTNNQRMGIARWDGVAWRAFGALHPPVFALAALPNGDLLAAGVGTPSVSGVTRWTAGVGWSALGLPFAGTPMAIAVGANGEIVVGGDFVAVGSVVSPCAVRWDGFAWQSLGAGIAGAQGSAVKSLVVLPGGDVLAGGTFEGGSGMTGDRLARFDGQAWTEVQGGCDGDVLTLHTVSPSEIVIGGAFRRAGVSRAGALARLATNCTAAVNTHGAGCIGAAGPMSMIATEEPWTGGTFRAVSSSFGPLSLAVSVFGFQSASVPLSLVLPQASPGCTLLVAPVAIDAFVPTAFTVQTQLSIPAVPSLGGAQLFHQVVSLQFAPTSGLIDVASTNAIALTVGAF